MWSVANIFSFYAIIAIEHGFQHLSQDLANANAWKIIFDPYTTVLHNKSSDLIY